MSDILYSVFFLLNIYTKISLANLFILYILSYIFRVRFRILE
jgi:hypothetical protein